MKTLIVRDGYATINGDKTQHELPSGSLDIVAEDGRALFCIRLHGDNGIEISAVSVCKQAGVVLDDNLIIAPCDSGRVRIMRPPYKD